MNIKYKLFKLKTHKEFNRCKQIKLTIENPFLKDLDRIFYAYIIEHIEKFGYYLVKCGFNLVFNDYEYCPYIKSKLSDNKSMHSC